MLKLLLLLEERRGIPPSNQEGPPGELVIASGVPAGMGVPFFKQMSDYIVNLLFCSFYPPDRERRKVETGQ